MHNTTIPGLSQDGQPYASPLVQVSRDSQVTWQSWDYPRMDSHMPPTPCPSILGFPSNLAIPGLSQDGQPYASPLVQVSQDSQVNWPSQDYPRMDSYMPPPCPSIPGFPSNLAIPGLSQDGQVTWESWDT